MSFFCFLFCFIKQDAYTVIQEYRDEGAGRREGREGREDIDRVEKRGGGILGCWFFIWFIHGLESVQEEGGGEYVSRSCVCVRERVRERERERERAREREREEC